jgi:hypothetical protein
MRGMGHFGSSLILLLLALPISAASISSSPAGAGPSSEFPGMDRNLKARLMPCAPAPADRINELYVFEDRAWCSEKVHTNGPTSFHLQFMDSQSRPIQRAIFKGYDLNKEGVVELVEYLLEAVQSNPEGGIYFSFDLPTFIYENIVFERRGFFVLQTAGEENAESALWCLAVNGPCELGTHVGSALDPSHSQVPSAPGISKADSVKITSDSKANAFHGLAGSTCGTMRSFSNDSMNGMAIAFFFMLSCLALIFSRRSKQKIAH